MGNSESKNIDTSLQSANTGTAADPLKLAFYSILIPLYNEEELVGECLARVVQAPLPVGLQREIIVVDDCSKDDSATIVEQFAREHEGLVRLVRHTRNQGKGAAIRTAISHARGEYCLIQDADLEYDPKDYSRLIRQLIEGRADAVYGSRFMTGGERRVLYYWHSVGNHLLTTLCNMAADLNLTDMRLATRPSGHLSSKASLYAATASGSSRRSRLSSPKGG